MKLRLYLVDDEIMANQYMIYLLQRTGIDVDIVGQATNSRKALYEIVSLKPDIVFADINMPVMDGLLLAEKILEKITTKIIFLTSYKDFDFVKKGMQLGAYDYILKNELNEEYLAGLLGKVMSTLKDEEHDRHVLLEYNVRQFLSSESEQNEDYTYRDKPMQRYGMVYMIPKPVINIRHVDEKPGEWLDCLKMEKLLYPEGITCNAVTNMSGQEYCAVFFIDEQVADGQKLLGDAAHILRRYFEDNHTAYCAIISETKYHFFELPEGYRILRKLSGYVYAAGEQAVLNEKDLTRCEVQEVAADQWIANINAAVLEQDQQKAWEILQAYFEHCRKNQNVWEYAESVNAFYRYLKEYVVSHGLRKAILDIPGCYDSAAQLEKTMSECLALVFETYRQDEKSEYSVYVQMAIEYICHNYSRDISIPDIAAHLQISDGHLRRLFRQEVGMKVVDYLTEYRLECAKLLMKNKESTLSGIWKKTGFASAQYFSYVFKKKEGKLPKDYMRQYREERE